MLVMVVFFIAFRWIHLSTPLIRLFLLVLILLLMPTLNFLPVWFALSLLRFRLPSRLMFTLALVRFPPTATKEIQYLNAKGALTYTDIAGDPVLYGNLPPREISMKDVFRSGDSSKKFKI